MLFSQVYPLKRRKRKRKKLQRRQEQDGNLIFITSVAPQNVASQREKKKWNLS